MSGRPSVTQRSYGALIVVLLLVFAVGSTALHWHNGWNDQRCQLCHLRNLPGALSPNAEDPIRRPLTERNSTPDNPLPELETFFAKFSSRAPPASICFTI